MLTQVLLFDAGNTIIELDFARLAAICAQHGSPVAADAMAEAAIRIRPDLDRFLRQPAASTESSDARAFFLALVFHRLGVPPENREPITEDILPALPLLWGCPVKGADETLTKLKARGHRLGVVSNSDGAVDRRIEEAGLLHHFEVVVDSGKVGISKPDPEIFRIALSAMDVIPSETTYLGDLPSVDVLGAARAGLTPLLIDPLDLFPEASCRRIRSITDLLDDHFSYDGGIGAELPVNE